MPVANQTFGAEYFGDLVEIVAGEWATPGHELVRRFPDCFVADRGTAGRGAQRSAGQSLGEPQAPDSLLDARERAPARVRTHGRPSLRKGLPRLTVALGSSARRTIEEEFLSTTRAGGVESGGWLYARLAVAGTRRSRFGSRARPVREHDAHRSRISLRPSTTRRRNSSPTSAPTSSVWATGTATPVGTPGRATETSTLG